MSETTCQYKLKSKRCHQPQDIEHNLRVCRFHYSVPITHGAEWESVVDSYYHGKVMAGLLTPSFELSEAETNALVDGVKRYDGRRLDFWVQEIPGQKERER